MDNKEKLYNALSEEYDLGTFEQFSADLDNEEKRRKLYDATSDDYDYGDYESFSAQLGYKEPFKMAEPFDMNKANEESLAGLTAPQQQAYVPSPSTDSQYEGQAPVVEQAPRRGFIAGAQESWKGLKAGTQFAYGEVVNGIFGSSQDDANALYELNEMLRQGKDVASEVEGAWTDAGREIRTGALEFLPGWAIKGLKDRVYKEAEHHKILDDIREVLGETNGDVAKARQILEERAMNLSHGDRVKLDAQRQFGNIRETEGFGAWLGENTVQMIPSASALIVGALTKSPAAARAIGMIGMGGMTAATSGSSMYEAREAGASDLETHKVGVVDGAIEYITEKLPFDNYTNWMVGKTKGKVATEVARALRSKNSPVRAEMEELLTMANKELGGKLFSKKNAAAYIADMVAEGASEFTAEASQTMTRLMYDNPDLFPLLGEALANGWQGALAGFFMGGVLGGASKTMEHHQNRERRQKQGYVDVGLVNFGTAENPDNDIVEVISVSEDTDLAQVLRDGAIINVNKNAIGQQYRYSYEAFEAGRMRVLESEALDNESVTQGMIQAADSREATAQQNLVEALRASGMADDEIMTLLEDVDADKIRMFDSTDIENAYNIYRDARHRARELRRTSARQAQSALNLKRLSIEENAGQFWRDNQTEDAEGNPIFNPTVETGLMQDGTRVYVLSDVNEQGECAAVTENGEKKIIKADMLQDGTQVFTLDEYLQSLVDADKVQQEQTRMVEQTQDRMTQARQAAQPGTQINLGTEEDPVIGSVVEQGPDGVIVQSEAGASQLTWDEYANAMHIGAPALTDNETAGVEAAEILSAESAYNNEVAQTESEAKEVADESGAALQEFEQADPLPRDAEGNVDETTLWNDSPARWAEWNDEQRQDGGANSIQAIDAAVAKLSATIAEQQAAYGAMPVGKERNAVEQEIASLQERLAELLNVQQRYVVPVAEEVTETAAEDPAAEVAEEPAVEAANPVRETLTQLYNDPELSESEIEAFINANVQESQKALDKHLDKAPKMGTDMAKYKAERAKHQAKTAELEKQRDFWREVQSYIEMPDVTEMDMEPQNALEFTANELTRKDGVKLQRDSFTRHTGYGSEAGNFLSMLRTKQNGGLTLEEAGERLMEMDRENDTGFFDQSDPNAGLNAILEVIGGARTSGDVSGYIKANREQLAREEMAAARNAMMEEMTQSAAEIVDNIEEDLPEDIFMRTVDETEAIGGAATVKGRAEAWEKRLGIKVNVLEDVSQVKNRAIRKAIERGLQAPGWFDRATGEVCIYAPQIPNMSEVDKTVIHEVISHKGLRGLLGEEGFNALCDYVWQNMKPEARAKYLTYEGVLKGERKAEYSANPEAFIPTEKESRAAADEFIAGYSESMNTDKNAWQKMIDSVKRFINKLTGNYSLLDQLDELLEASLARYETIAKMDLQGVVEEGQTYGGIIDAETGAKIDASSDIQAEGNVSFRAKDGSLVGMHNISEDKLRKAIKQGGLANPSTAVVNIDEYSLEGYGEISLIMPSSLVDPETGDNAGTYSGDAWTPTYPPISRKVDDRGWEAIKDRIRAAVGEESALYSDIVHGVNNYLDDNHRSKMEFVFLKEKGIEPEIKYKGAEGLVGIRNLEAILGVEGLRYGWESYEKYKAASPMSKRSFNMWVDSGGDKTAHRELKEMLKKEPKLADVLKLNEDLPFSRFDSFTYHIWKTERDAGRVDTYDTMAAASSYVDANNLRAEFEQWLESLMEQAGAREVFFAGFTRDGDRIYKDNTLENVSRHMWMQGRINAYDDKGLSATKSVLLERFESLSQIRRNRGRLADERTYNKAYDELKDRLYNIISQLSDMEAISSNPFINLDYAESRLQEALTKRNPVAYLNKEYGYSIDPKGEYASELKSFIKDVQKMPAKYFETKFERPVYLNEFAAAVMPATTGEDIKQAISEAGLPIYEYDSSVEGARHEATLKATDDNDVRFRIIGEEGAANLDAAEEASVRLDNLTAAREMEAAGKDAKAIKLATGWERGTDNLWRYEVPDDFDLTELENRLQENLNDGMSKAWGIVYPSDLGDLINEYPDFNVDIMVWVGDEFENTGEYSPATEGDENTFGRSASIEVRAKTVADIKSVLVHEIQHVIQEKEGFAEGGNAFGLKDKLSAELDKRVEMIKELRAEGRDAEADELMSMSKGLAEAVINNEDDAYGNYRKLAGEVEARNASARLGMTMQERREGLLSETEDVAPEDQIILMEGLSDVSNATRTLDTTSEVPTIGRSDIAKMDKAYMDAVEASVMEGQVMFRVRGENESAMDFHQSMVDDFLAKYNPNAEVLVFPVNEDTAKRFGYTLEELNDVNGIYVPDEDIIAIFAHEDETDGDEVENTLFHESIHKLATFYPYMKQAGKWMLDNADQDGVLSDYKVVIDEDYSNFAAEDQQEEMLTHVLSGAMAMGQVDRLFRYLPASERDICEQILNEIEYDRERESRERIGRGYQESEMAEADSVSETSGESESQAQEADSEGLSFRVTDITPEVRAEMDTISAIALVNGTYLKAPNGADTNLTPEQWALVRTKNFLRWFGDWINDPENASKVVDENGEPKVVYHGGSSTFNRFDTSLGDGMTDLGQGSYFSSNEAVAREYTVPNGDNQWQIDSYIEEHPYLRELSRTQLGLAEAERIAIREVFKTAKLYSVFLNLRNPYRTTMEDFKDGDFVYLYNRDGLKGYDGIIDDTFKERFEDFARGAVQYVAFDPSQIKSATDNTGEFSEEDGDIRYRISSDSETGIESLVERTFRTSGAFSFSGKEKIESRDDVAFIFKQLEDSAIENSFLVFVKDGIPTVIHVGMGGTSYAMIDNSVVLPAYKDFGADKIYMVHNHPSGSLYASKADQDSLKTISMQIPDVSVEGIIINTVSGEYASFDLSSSTQSPIPTDEGTMPVKVLSFDKNVFAPDYKSKINERKIKGSDDVASFLSAHRLGEGTKVGALLLNRQNMINGNLVTNDNEVSVENADTLASQIAEAANRTGSSAVILFGDFDYSDRAVRSLSKGIKRASGNTIDLLDVVRLEGNHTLSLADETLPSRSTLVDGIRFRTSEEAQELLNFMQDNAETLAPRQLTEDIWKEEIEGKTFSSPIGIVRLGHNQFDKNINKGRAREFGMLIPTIERPDLIFEESAPEEGAERQTKYVFVKTFINESGAKHINYASISVQKEGMEVVESSHRLRDKQVLNKIEKEHMLWNRFASDSTSSAPGISTDQSNALSDNKDSDNIDTSNEYDENISYRITGTPTEQVVAEGVSLSPADMARVAGRIFSVLPEEARREVTASLNGNILGLQDAIMQIPARLAMKQDWDEQDMAVAEAIASEMDRITPDKIRPFSTYEGLWMLYDALTPASSLNLMDQASRAIVKRNLGVDEATLERMKKDADDVRFRATETAEVDALVGAYNQSASFWKNRLYEVFVDQYDSVDGLVKSIEESTGMKAKSFEDVVSALNQMPAKSGAKTTQMVRKYIIPMWDAIKELVTKYDLTEAKIARYTKLKHGLERNEEFPRRDARAFYRAAFEKKIASINADKSLSDAEKDAQKKKAQDDLDFHFASIESGSDAKFQEFREKDYSGIMAMYEDSYDNLADAEEAAKAEVESFEDGKENEIKELWKRINALNKATLKVQYETGQIGKAAYESLKEQFKYYVPLRGFEKETAEDQFSYYAREFSSFEAAVLKAKGRKTEAESPFGHMGAMMASAIVAGEKNEAKLALYYFALNRKDNGLLTIKDVWYIKREDSDAWELSLPPVKGEGESVADYGQRMDAWEDRMKTLQGEGKAKKGKQNLNLADIVHIDDSSEREHYIRVQVAGQEKWMIINGNPRAAQAINGLLNLESDPYFNKFFGKVMRELAQLSTSYNPEFWMTNLERDFMTTFATVVISEDAEYRKAFFKNYKEAWKVVKMLPKLKDGTLGDTGLEGILKEAVAGGLQTGFSHIKANEVWDKEMEQHFQELDAGKAKQAIRSTFDKLQNFSESMELVSRFAVYMTSRQMGKSVAEAVADGKEVTANFNRKGSGRAISFEEAKKITTRSGKTFREEYGEIRGAIAEALIVAVSRFAEFGRKYILFFNASVQGLDKWFRLARRNKGNARKLAAYFGGQFALGFIMSLLHGMLDDDDEYQENVSDYDRRNNFMIGGNGYYIKVALPHDVRTFYGMGDIFYNYVSGNYKHHSVKEAAKTVAKQAGSLLPVNPFNGWSEFVPAFIKPIIEAGAPFNAFGIEGTNENFAGMPIRKKTPWLTDEDLERTPKYTLAGDYTWDWLVNVSEALNRVTGGTYKEAGKIDIDPARIQHYIEGWTGGVGRTTGNFATFISQLIGEEEWKAANTPFLNKILTITDERSQNRLSNDQFYHYSDVGEAALSRAKAYEKDGEMELLAKEVKRDEYKIGFIYTDKKKERQYKKTEEMYRKQLKEAKDEAEEKRIKELRDANRKRFLKELEDLDLL